MNSMMIMLTILSSWILGLLVFGQIAAMKNNSIKTIGLAVCAMALVATFAAVWLTQNVGLMGLAVGTVGAFLQCFDIMGMTQKKADEIGAIARAEEDARKQREEEKNAAKRKMDKEKKEFEDALAHMRKEERQGG